MTGRRWPGRVVSVDPVGDAAGVDRGAFTAELAAGLPALMVLLTAGLMAVSAVAAQGQCLDAAREAALAEARGGSGAAEGARVAPPGAEIYIGGDADVVTARVRVRVRVLGANLSAVTVEGTATAAREPDALL